MLSGAARFGAAESKHPYRTAKYWVSFTVPITAHLHDALHKGGSS
jgi:hypothetical protein